MDGLYVDTFGMPPIDDLSNNSALSQSTPNLYCTSPNKPAPCSKRKEKRPNSQLCRIFGSLYNRRGDDNESSGINKSALELAIRRARAVRLSPLSSEKEDDCHRITLEQNKSATNSPLQLASENEGEKLVEESRIVDEYWCCCSTGDCSCIYDCGDNRYCPHRARYDAGFWNREGFDRHSSGSCNCYCCCCEGNYGLHPSHDDYDDDDDVTEIEIEFGHILGLVKLWLTSATEWAKQIYIGSVMAVGLGQQRDDEVD
ncbi:hypothetical protein F4801DRAFT_596234 [Xylaria longipes]|nr:hypothetical protein F4801DRAFT_596234 [Xylaria longipes]